MNNQPTRYALLRVAIAAAAGGILICLWLLIGETPYTLVAFMFLAQPLLLVALVVFGWNVVLDLRRKGLL
jgi:hypothetical protein